MSDDETGEVVDQFGTITELPAGAPADQGGALASVAQQHVAPTTEVTKEAATRRAQGAYSKQQMRAVGLTLPLRGDGELTAKTVVRIDGLGPKLSGLYYLTSVKHQISGSGGYTMSVKARRDGQSSAVGNEQIRPTTSKTEAKTSPHNESAPTSTTPSASEVSGSSNDLENGEIHNQFGEVTVL
jgi:hypothetical protein